MGDCNYCGNKAGLFSNQHKECREDHDSALNGLRQQAVASAKGQLPVDNLIATLPGLGEHYVQDHEVRATLIQGFEDAVDGYLEDQIISKTEEDMLDAYASSLDISEQERDRNGAQTRAVMGAVLRQVAEGETPQRQRVNGQMPFNFQKSEEFVWLFNRVKLYEERSRTEYRGGSTGVSVRVAKGVYLRQSAFKGHPVVTTELTHLDTGLLALTTKHLYFAGPRVSNRTPYAKIVAFRPYDDGLGIQRDARTAKPQVYVLDEGWFAYNLARNLAER